MDTYQSALALDALGDPTRRAILELLRDGPRPVVELASALPVSRPAVSQHLRVLENARLVRVDPQGSRRLYSIRREGLEELKQYLDGFWSDALSAYAAEITRRKKGERRRS